MFKISGTYVLTVCIKIRNSVHHLSIYQLSYLPFKTSVVGCSFFDGDYLILYLQTIFFREIDFLNIFLILTSKRFLKN